MFDAERIKNDIIDWIKTYFDENGKNCTAVLGISGGKDSSIAAALCAQAIGADRVLGVLMPQGEQRDIVTAYEVGDFLKIRHIVVNIANTVDTLSGDLQQSGIILNKQAKQNTPARIRMSILYAVAATVDGRVVNTSNLSESWIGYSTKFGDGAGDFSPLANLTATETAEIGRVMGLPLKFTDKTPEDGLSGLTDEENFGFTYAILDNYIRSGVCEDPAAKEKIDTLRKHNNHKTQPIPAFRF